MEANIYTSYTETESESSSSESESEDNYINMEPGRDSSSSSSFFQSFLINNKEFEFQSFSNSSSDRHTTTSPADELFYMGKLLPLHRLHQIQNDHGEEEEEYPFGGNGGGTPLFSTPTANTPFQSCNISPAESCHVSRELNPAEYFADYNNNNNNNNNLSPELLGQQLKKSRPPKQSKNNNSSSSSMSIGIGSKLKWAYLKSLFTTSGCAAADQSQQHLPKVKHYCHKSSAKVNTHAPPPSPQAFGQIKSKKKTSSSDYNNNNYIAKKENTTNNLVEGHHHHRRSFSGAFKRKSKTKTKKPSSSSTNSGTADSKRCGGGSSSEIDSSIQAAIAHCKRSQKVDKERAFCSISASYI